jgi:predicted DNA-binding mobile mystery protein A
MKQQYKNLLLEQLDATMTRLSCLRGMRRPVKGWLRAVREALGMSGKQFAMRLRVSAPRVSALEKGEVRGSVTLNTMRQAAAALNCSFVYNLVPLDGSLGDILRKRARILARKRISTVDQSMLLEDQRLSAPEQEKALEAEIEALLRKMPKDLWDNHD